MADRMIFSSNFLAQLLQAFLVADAEALLFIHYEQPEILESNVL